MPITLTCQTCNKSFAVPPSHIKAGRKYCSLKCFYMRSGNPVKYVCQNCKREYSIKAYDAKRGRTKFCSKKCYNTFRYRMAGTKYHPGWKGIECVCKTCGKKFLIRQTQLKKGYGKHCSMECRKLERIKCICEFCNKPFYRLESQIAPDGYGRFCSQSCRSKHTVRDLHITSPTSIEQSLIDEFDRYNTEYEFQYSLETWIVDFAFPAHKLIVEADGIYWHGLEHIKERDARKDAYLQSQGWTVLRFTGDEIRESPSACVDEIIKHFT